MSLLALVAVVVLALIAGYLLYGSFIARQYRLDDSRTTPAVSRSDGVDFVPTRPFYLLGQHFSAIAAAGPIVGPIAACIAFGWLPSLLWIVIGVILIGAVHDFSALVASVRHGACSIAELARQHLGRRAWVSLVAFIWLALLYVIVAFTDVTASTFIGNVEELQGGFAFNPGGAVAAASAMYLALALLMGLVQRCLRPKFWLVTLIFVPATLGVVWLGTRVSGILVFDIRTWHIAILVYCFVASLLPLWLLQQPRGYLGGFVLYLAIGVGLLGILLGGFTIDRPAFTPAVADAPGGLAAWLFGARGEGTAPPLTSLLFPFLFVTIACGACSGFHGLVCGGTTSRQIARESHCKPIAFGAMLLEGLVAVIALATVMIVAPGDGDKRAPSIIYGDGLARFLTKLIGEDSMAFARTFGTMAVATFVFDTLDVATRLGRYLLQELFGTASRAVGALASFATAGIPLLILFAAPEGSWRQFWTLFGTANQLLAGLTLVGVSVWLARERRRYWYTFIPMLFIMTITLSAVTLQIIAGARVLLTQGFSTDPALINAAVGVLMLGLAVMFLYEGWRHSRGTTGLPPPRTNAPA